MFLLAALFVLMKYHNSARFRCNVRAVSTGRSDLSCMAVLCGTLGKEEGQIYAIRSVCLTTASRKVFETEIMHKQARVYASAHQVMQVSARQSW